MGSKTRKLLALSPGVNVMAAAAVAHAIRFRGGWIYLKTTFAGTSENIGIGPDAANYTHRQSLFEILLKPRNRIVFAGDSLTQGCEWSEFYPGALNRGIGGDTIAGLLKRVGSITELNPRAVFLVAPADNREHPRDGCRNPQRAAPRSYLAAEQFADVGYTQERSWP